MPIFEVEITQKELYVLEVDAENVTQAESKAWLAMEHDGKETYHYDSDATVDVVEL